MFPELLERFKRFFPEQEVLSLGLKEITFSSITAAEYAKSWPQIALAMGGGLPSYSGESVSRLTALNHSVFWACNKIVTEAVGFLPAHVMQERGREKRHATEKPMYMAFKMAPNVELTAQAYREMGTSHCLLQGNHYSQIVRRSGTGVAVELRPLDPDLVMPDREKQGQKRLVYVVREDGTPDKTYTVEEGKPHDILHIRGLGWDGVRGYSVIEVGRQSIGTALGAEKNVGMFWKRGGRLPYVLESPKHFKNQSEADDFRKDFNAVYDQPHLAVILQDEMKYHQIGLSNKDAQALEMRQFTIPEICRWFSVSPHLAGDLSRATFSNIVELELEFVKKTLTPWLVRWEQEFWRCVLTDEEKSQGYFLRHNVNGLLRGDFKTRVEGYAALIQNGVANRNECREFEDWNPYEGGDSYTVQTNMGTIQPDGTIEPPATPRGTNEQTVDAA